MVICCLCYELFTLHYALLASAVQSVHYHYSNEMEQSTEISEENNSDEELSSEEGIDNVEKGTSENDSSNRSADLIALENKLATNEVLKRINYGYFDTVKPSDSTKSQIWQFFSIVRNINENKRLHFVQCKRCLKVYRHAPKSGTSHLKNHNKWCKEKNGATDREIHQTMEEGKMQTLKDTLTDDIALWSAVNIRPFEISRDFGFKLVVKDLCDTLTHPSFVDVEQILPDPTTVSKRVSDLYEKNMTGLLPVLAAAIEQGNLYDFRYKVMMFINKNHILFRIMRRNY